ncbi:MAG TPA: GtrA family protein [Clostridiaceae bacterium]|nr:GtrA family protein [Clostridiaceae bacterium]
MSKAVLEKFRQREFILYLISGIIVTLTNWITYYLLENLVEFANWRISNIISIGFSIFVAYLLNRIFVFHSEQNIFPEIFKFFVSRFLISLIFEHGLMELLLTVIGFDPRILIFGYEFQVVKVLGSVFVVLANYFVSKYLVFRKSKSKIKES